MISVNAAYCWYILKPVIVSLNRMLSKSFIRALAHVCRPCETWMQTTNIYLFYLLIVIYPWVTFCAKSTISLEHFQSLLKYFNLFLFLFFSYKDQNLMKMIWSCYKNELSHSIRKNFSLFLFAVNYHYEIFKILI